MKTVYDRLKPHAKDALQNALTSYPLTYDFAVRELKKETNLFNITLSTQTDLCRALNEWDHTKSYFINLFEQADQYEKI